MSLKELIFLVLKSSTVQNFRSCLHRSPYGVKATSEKPYENLEKERSEGRLQHSRSCVLSTYLAISGEDTTTTGTRPSFKCMRGPCFFESSQRERCSKLLPKRWRWPMTGSLGGPGGSFQVAEPPLAFRPARRSEDSSARTTRRVGR